MRHCLIPISILLASTACSMTSNVGESDAGRFDGTTPPIPSGPYDECGNGMDDDVDGRIDEGCPCGAGETQACFSGRYPNRRVGTCADGVQCISATFLCDGAEDCDDGSDEN